MRSLLLCLAFILPVTAIAQEATWISTQGPGYASTSDLLLDAEGRLLMRTPTGQSYLFADGAWTPFTSEQGLLAVADADRFITARNYRFGGSGQNPFYEHHATLLVWLQTDGEPEEIGGFTYTGGFAGGYAEQALVAPDGSAWAGFQQYDAECCFDPDGVGLAHLTAEDLATDPDNWSISELSQAANVLHALSWSSALGLLVATDDGIYASIDDTWSRLGLADTPIFTIAEMENGDLLAGGDAGQVFRSSDDGTTWATVAPLPGRVNHLLSIDGAVLAAVDGSGVYQTASGGDAWTATDLTASAFDLAGTDGGPYYAAAEGSTVYVSENGSAWIADRFVNTTVRTLGHTPSGIVAPVGPFYRFTDDAWQEMSFDVPRLATSGFAVSPTTGAYHAAVAYDRQDEYPGDYRSRLYRSGDEGTSWQNVRTVTGLVTGLTVSSEGTILVCRHFVEDGCTIERSTDQGQTWITSVANHWPAKFYEGPSGTLYAVETIGTWEYGNGFSVSTDDGETWESRSGPETIQTLLETLDGTLIYGGCDGAYRSMDGGLSWTDTDLTVPVGALTENSAGDLFAGASGCATDPSTNSPGVYRSTDGGQTWHPYGLDGRPVYAFALDAEDVLLAGTNRGVFRTEMTTVDAKGPAAPQSFAVGPAYPNPFIESTTITLALDEPGLVTAKVFDALGRTVATLQDGPLATGTHRLTWDADRGAGGTYFVRIVAPSGSRTVPVTVVR